ncbi:MAG: hypothetical protein QOE14_2261, partial [Humisphaera sp.]|nr:hypothetical protein [Humisphaera sp.]
GKVVFTSFPINALETSQPQAAVLWEQLLSLREPRWEWNRSQLGDARHAVVGGMIGRKVAPWAVAAGVAAGYLLVIVAAQGIFFGAARPRAFVVTIAAAIVASALLLVMGMARRSDQSLQSARLAVIDVASGGNGWQQETIAFVGADDPKVRLAAADERVSIRPSLADARNRPMIRQQPFIVEKSEVYGDRIERAWEAAGPADPMWRISAVADLGAGGLTLDVDNGLGSVLESPLVIWNGRALAIADLPTGRTTVRDVQVNPRQQFTGLGVLTSDQAKRRAQVVAASLAPPSETTVGTSANVPPMLIGWVADAGASLVRPEDHDAMEQKSMAMVRTPLRFHVPPPGSAVTVPAALVRVVPGRMPYDVTKDESVPSQQDGQWLVGFELPKAVGHVRPKRATLELRVNVPGHQLVVRQNQCMDGAAQADALQEPIGAWDRAVASPRVNIDLGPRDVDRAGRVWLLFDVHSVGAVSGNNPLSWQIEDLGLSVEAEAVAPPDPIAFEPTTTTKPTEGEGNK